MCDWGRDVPTQLGEGAGAVRVLGTERERGGGEPRSHTIAWAFPEEPNIWNSRNHADFLFSFFKLVFPSYFISQWRLVRFLVRRDGHCSSAGHAPRATASPAPPAPGGLCPLQKGSRGGDLEHNPREGCAEPSCWSAGKGGLLTRNGGCPSTSRAGCGTARSSCSSPVRLRL